MDVKKNSASHVFHDSIDPESLTALYANDYVWIEEIFGTVLANYDQDLGEIKRSFDSGDLEGLRKSVHKISPAFGFIGMIRMQEICKKFEDRCRQCASFSEVKDEAGSLIKSVSGCREILEKEYDRLKSLNNSGQ